MGKHLAVAHQTHVGHRPQAQSHNQIKHLAKGVSREGFLVKPARPQLMPVYDVNFRNNNKPTWHVPDMHLPWNRNYSYQPQVPVKTLAAMLIVCLATPSEGSYVGLQPGMLPIGAQGTWQSFDNVFPTHATCTFTRFVTQENVGAIACGGHLVSQTLGTHPCYKPSWSICHSFPAMSYFHAFDTCRVGQTLNNEVLCGTPFDPVPEPTTDLEVGRFYPLRYEWSPLPGVDPATGLSPYSQRTLTEYVEYSTMGNQPRRLWVYDQSALNQANKPALTNIQGGELCRAVATHCDNLVIRERNNQTSINLINNGCPDNYRQVFSPSPNYLTGPDGCINSTTTTACNDISDEALGRFRIPTAQSGCQEVICPPLVPGSTADIPLFQYAPKYENGGWSNYACYAKQPYYYIYWPIENSLPEYVGYRVTNNRGEPYRTHSLPVSYTRFYGGPPDADCLNKARNCYGSERESLRIPSTQPTSATSPIVTTAAPTTQRPTTASTVYTFAPTTKRPTTIPPPLTQVPPTIEEITEEEPQLPEDGGGLVPNIPVAETETPTIGIAIGVAGAGALTLAGLAAAAVIVRDQRKKRFAPTLPPIAQLATHLEATAGGVISTTEV